METEKTKPLALVLLSGGMDSAVTLAIARQDFRCIALVFDYAQRHRYEIDYAIQTIYAQHLENHFVVKLQMPTGSSPLTDPTLVLENGLQSTGGVSSAFVPGRNLIFLSYALVWSQRFDIHHIFIGVNAQDQEGFPDCRPAFIRSFEATANRALGINLHTSLGYCYIQTPLIHWLKPKIICLGRSLNVDFSLTRSCYNLNSAGWSCGVCDACKVRLAGFTAVGIKDPIPYIEV